MILGNLREETESKKRVRRLEIWLSISQGMAIASIVIGVLAITGLILVRYCWGPQ